MYKEFRVTALEQAKWSSSQPFFESMIVGRMREHGFPVNGVLVFRGLSEDGVIIRDDDFKTGDIIYRFRAD